MKMSRCLVLSAASAVIISGPALSHHANAMFEWGVTTPLRNMTVERWEWTNPHTFLYARDEEGQRWAFEGMSPNHLARHGWSKSSLRPGEKIDVTYYPLRDRRRGGFNVSVTKPDGSVLKQLGEAAPRPPR